MRENLLEDERDRRRLADAGGAEHGEVLAQHFLEVDVGGNGRVELEAADLDRLAAIDAVDDGNVAGAEARDGVADCRIARNAALERSVRLP